MHVLEDKISGRLRKSFASEMMVLSRAMALKQYWHTREELVNCSISPKLTSSHSRVWLEDPTFWTGVEDALPREGVAISRYCQKENEHLECQEHSGTEMQRKGRR